MVKSQKGEIVGLGADGNHIRISDKVTIICSPAKGKKVALESGNIHRELTYDDLINKIAEVVGYDTCGSNAIIQISNLKIRIPLNCLTKIF